MDKTEALRLIKALRDTINDQGSEKGDDLWINRVVFHLDQAADVIEFPKVNGAPA